MTETNGVTAEPHVDADVELLDAAGVPVLRITPHGARNDAALIHFHGGGYRKGSPQLFAASVARIAAACRMQVFSVGYRLSTMSAFPAAVDDAVASYRWITDQIRSDRIALWGDSAGGGLAAATLLRLRKLEIPGPAGAFLFSPWADLRNIAQSYEENAASDGIFSHEQATEAAASYLAGHAATDPLASPVLGDWAGQPRLIVQASNTEVLRDDALMLSQVATEAGVDVRLKIHDRVPHIWNLAYPSTPASELAVGYMAEQLEDLFTCTAPA